MVEMNFIRAKMNKVVFQYREESQLIFGFTETDSDIERVAEFFNVMKIVQLDQVHGDTIHFTSGVKGYPEGDGLILDETKVMAAIRTADCTPLFFRSGDGKTAGVVHVGWRGLQAGIVGKLLGILSQKGTGTHDLIFFTGPAIGGECYTVQKDVVDLFKEKNCSKQIFNKVPEGYSMDVTKGIELSLLELGVPQKNIGHSGICTYCDPRFPSYRRGDREKRIFSFIIRK